MVVYYSASGNTKEAAQYIAETAGGELLAELAGTGEWQEGKSFQSSVSREEIENWVKELGL